MTNKEARHIWDTFKRRERIEFVVRWLWYMAAAIAGGVLGWILYCSLSGLCK